MSLKAIRFRVEFAWGFSAGLAGRSKTSPSFLFPPPLTVLGAASRQVALRLGESSGYSEGSYARLISDVASRVKAVALRPINAIPNAHVDINRVIIKGIIGGKERPNVDELDKSFDAPGRGKTYYTTADDSPPALEVVIVQERGGLITLDDVWGISRIGSRESLVSVIDAVEEDAERTELRESSEVRFSTPSIKDEVEASSHELAYSEYYLPFWMAGDLANASRNPWLYYQSEVRPVRYLIPRYLWDERRPGRLLVRLSQGGGFAIYRLQGGDLVVGRG